jgi:hypothetical protein
MCPWLCRIPHDIATHRGGLVSACPRQLRRVAAAAAVLTLVAARAADVFTAQLGRSDMMPDRLSPGWVNIPGPSVMAVMGTASDLPYSADRCQQALDVTRLCFQR